MLDTEVGYAEKFIKNVFQKLYKIQPSGLLKTAMDHGDSPREPLFLAFCECLGTFSLFIIANNISFFSLFFYSYIIVILSTYIQHAYTSMQHVDR